MNSNNDDNNQSKSKSSSSSSKYSNSKTNLNEYNYESVHADLENHHFIGNYGWDHSCYLAIAEKKAKIDLTQIHKIKRNDDEYYIPEIKQLLENKNTRFNWNNIITFDPFGMTATNPTIAATTATLNIPGTYCHFYFIIVCIN